MVASPWSAGVLQLDEAFSNGEESQRRQERALDLVLLIERSEREPAGGLTPTNGLGVRGHGYQVVEFSLISLGNLVPKQ